MTGKWWLEGRREFKKTPLLPELLSKAGYRSQIVGKWHLSGTPMDRGFDHFFGFLGGLADYFEGSKDFYLDRKPYTDFGPNYYSADEFTNRAVQFIKSPDNNSKDKPFFLYLSYQSPHNPLQVPKEDIQKYRGKYLKGWQAMREDRFKRQKALGIVPKCEKLPDYPENLPEWNSLTPEQKDLEDLRRAVYVAMIERMDAGIAKVLKALEESGNADNTLIMFMSDNGTDPYSSGDARNLEQGILPGDLNSNWQNGTGWAYVSDTPWRLYKISQHAGGVTTGGILWWPGNTGKSGRIEDSPIHFVDILPTLMAATKQSTDSLKMDGESFLPLVKGDAWKRKTPMYFQMADNRAIRTDEWTMAEVDAGGWELFHIANDPFENKNVANENPKIVAELSSRWTQWWKNQTKNATYPMVEKKENNHSYAPQGDRGTGKQYIPTAMPAKLKDRYPIKK